jgi:hypothetical protein
MKPSNDERSPKEGEPQHFGACDELRAAQEKAAAELSPGGIATLTAPKPPPASKLSNNA